ncbi:ribose-phosphate diphosphokinase [Patescibacteria group bacterium]|nr:ribose-phosphate diphosphokinase [Patescibacteria group bacterium]
MKIDLIPTLNSEHIARILSKNPDFHIHYIGKNKNSQRYFPDGEVYVNLGKLCKRKIVVLHSGAPNPNDGLVELEFVLNLLKDRRMNPVELFITYFPYGRQDSVFKNGEINAAEVLIKKWINIYGVKKIYIVDTHFKGKDWVSKYPIEHISGVGILKKAVSDKYPEVFFIAPDAGSARRNNLPGFIKKRKNSYDIEISCDKNFEKDIKGKIVGVIDDMVETGGTMVCVHKKCKDFGALKTIAMITHGVLQSGVDKINNIYDELFLTNTIKCNGVNVDISSLIVNSLIDN